MVLLAYTVGTHACTPMHVRKSAPLHCCIAVRCSSVDHHPFIVFVPDSRGIAVCWCPYLGSKGREPGALPSAVAKSGLGAVEAPSSIRFRDTQKLNIYVASLAKLWLGCDHLLLPVDTHPADRHRLQQWCSMYLRTVVGSDPAGEWLGSSCRTAQTRGTRGNARIRLRSLMKHRSASRSGASWAALDLGWGLDSQMRRPALEVGFARLYLLWDNLVPPIS